MNVEELSEQIAMGRKMIGKQPRAVIRIGEAIFSIRAVKIKGGKIPLMIIETENGQHES